MNEDYNRVSVDNWGRIIGKILCFFGCHEKLVLEEMGEFYVVCKRCSYVKF